MHTNHTWSKGSKLAQLLAMLVTTALIMLGVTTLPTYAAAPTLKLAITPDEKNPTKGDVDFGYVPNNTIKGTVYRDDNRDKTINGDEPGLERVSVQLLDEDGKVLQTLDTDADGNYAFQHLPAGNYRVRVHPDGDLAGLDQTEDPDGIADSMSGEITIGFDNQLVTGVNFGYVAPNIPATRPKQGLAQRLARTGFDGLIGGGPGSGLRWRHVPVDASPSPGLTVIRP